MCTMDESRGVGNNGATILSKEIVVIEGAAFHQEILKPRQEEEEEVHDKPFHGVLRRVPVNKVRIVYTFFSVFPYVCDCVSADVYIHANVYIIFMHEYILLLPFFRT